MTFNKNQIVTFNNATFSAGTMEAMPSIHPTTERLYTAARELKDVSGQSAVARLLDISPQAMKNWEARGVSEGGALKAQRRIGCDANWILQGELEMRVDTWAPATATVLTIQEHTTTYRTTGEWPFSTFAPDDYALLDVEYRQKIEDQLLGAITRIKQAINTQLGKHA